MGIRRNISLYLPRQHFGDVGHLPLISICELRISDE